jgi:transcriptional regulator with XRE-family HTH domain
LSDATALMRIAEKSLTARERVARNLIDWRLKREMSQFSLAKHAHISQTYISQVENGMRSISIDKLDQMAEALQIDVSALLKA